MKANNYISMEKSLTHNICVSASLQFVMNHPGMKLFRR